MGVKVPAVSDPSAARYVLTVFLLTPDSLSMPCSDPPLFMRNGRSLRSF